MKARNEWSVVEVARNIKDTLEMDKDFALIVDGETGSGKSTLAIKLAKKVCPWFNMENDIVYSRDEFVEKITTAKKGSAIIVDEAINVLFRRDFAAKKQKFLLRLLDMCRNRNLCLIMCVPNFWSMDKHILDGRIKLRVYVPSTGIAFMWKPSKNPFAPDRWYRKFNEKISTNWDVTPNARKTKGFIGMFHFGDLGPVEKERYLVIKEKKKQEVKEAEEEQEQKDEQLNLQSFEHGRMWMGIWLEKRKLVKTGTMGWRSTFCKFENITSQALYHRIRSFKEKIESGDISIKPIAHSEINNNRELIPDIEPPSETIQHSAI